MKNKKGVKKQSKNRLTKLRIKMSRSENITANHEQLEQMLQYQSDMLEHVFDAIISTDLNFNIRTWNKAAESIYGWKFHEVVDRPVEKITRLKYLDDQKKNVLKQLRYTGHWVGELVQKRKDKSTLNVLSSVSLIKDRSNKSVGIIMVNHDITKRKRVEEKIKASLREKELLLREIHHRVKNNMQIIYSLLSLQSQHIDDKKSLQFFRECQNRIRSMALIHEHLYRSQDLTKIDSVNYFDSLLKHLFHSYGVKSGTIMLKKSIESIAMSIDTAIPCGLIINELISNSLKYAFRRPFKKRKAEIIVGFCNCDIETIELMVGDNGVGLPSNLDIKNTETLGLKLVKVLVDQLKGSIELDRRRGVTFKIRFRNNTT